MTKDWTRIDSDDESTWLEGYQLMERTETVDIGGDIRDEWYIVAPQGYRPDVSIETQDRDDGVYWRIIIQPPKDDE